MSATDMDIEEQEVINAAARIILAGQGPNLIDDDVALAEAQFMVAPGSARDLLGHWSVERGDSTPQREHIAAEFARHMDTCDPCRFLEEVESIRQAFEVTACETCGGDLDGHVIGPDPLGHAYAYCPDEEM
jgi:hypothetical protein